MRVLFRLARRYVSRRFLQSVLFVFGVALGVAMVIAIDVANNSASRAFSLSTESITGKATHQILGGPVGLPGDLYRRIRIEGGVRDSAPIVTEYVRAVELGDQPLRLLGIDPFAEPPFRSYLGAVAVQGETTNNFDAISSFIAEPNTVLISLTLAQRFGVETGDSITLRPGTRLVEVRVVGVLRPDDRVSEQALSDLILTDISTAQDITGMEGKLTRIDLILPEDNRDALVERLTGLLPPGARLASTSETGGTLTQMTAAFELNLQALSLLALVVGVFLIYNTVTFSVVQRRPIIGILRSIGATKEQIFLLILGEALILGVVGTVFGLGLGLIFGRASVGLVSQTISDLYFTVNVQQVTVDTYTLVKGAAIGLLASVGAALIPSIDATRTLPAGVMRRSSYERSTQRLIPLITGAAVVLNITGLILLQIPSQDIILSFMALFCIVVGSAFFTPVVLITAMRFVVPVTGRLFGVLGRMAPRAVSRSLSRTSVAVASLTIAVSVIVGVSVMISSFRNTVQDWLLTTLGADIYISPPLLTSNVSTVDTPPEIREIIAGVEGVERAAASRSVSVSAPHYPDLPPVNLHAVDYDIADRRTFAWQSVDDYQAALNEGAVIISEPFAFRRGITPENNTITLLTDQGEQAFEVVGVYYDYSTDQGTVYMDTSVYRQFYDDPFISAVAAYIEPDADLNVVIGRIREVLSGYDLLVQANRELRAGVFEVFDNAFAITIALRLLATVVAFIGILSALLSLQLENTRQYGVMRAVGMTPVQLWNFTLIQTGLMGTVAGVLALPIGLALALVLLFVINVRSFGWTMQLYPTAGEFALAFGVAVIAAFVAGIYPAYRLTQLVIARALRSE
jgi:putative ABC transport system permease protein